MNAEPSEDLLFRSAFGELVYIPDADQLPLMQLCHHLRRKHICTDNAGGWPMPRIKTRVTKTEILVATEFVNTYSCDFQKLANTLEASDDLVVNHFEAHF